VWVLEAVFERVMMPDPQQHLAAAAGVVEPAAETHPIRYLCDSFIRLKMKSRANKVQFYDTNTAILTVVHILI